MSREFVTNNYGRFDLTFHKGQGSYLYDEKGEKYLDFVAGIAVNSLGHCHPALVKTIKEQSETLWHISNLYWNQTQNMLAEELAKQSGLSKVSFCNSGAEANETAIKAARKYGYQTGGTQKNNIIYMKNSFHGRTMGALAVTGQNKYQEKFRPLMSGVTEAVFNELESVKKVMNEHVCAIIAEPIQGEGGVMPAEKEFLQGLRTLCDQYGALLIFDEVQCGIGRSGKMFAYQVYDVMPDIACVAKGLGGGFPIGAMVANEKAANALEPGDHGSTFGGNPMACACGLTVLKELTEGGVMESVKEKNERLIDRLNEIKKKHSLVKEIRGIGLLLGLRVEDFAKEIINKCMQNHLLLVGAGEQVIRFVPPLTVSLEEIDQAMERLEKAICEIS